MSFWDRFRRKKPASLEEATINPDVTPKDLQKVYAIKSLAVGGQVSTSGRGAFEDSDYDFDKIIRAYQTDSFLKMAMSKYQELMWKSGYELVSENPQARVYLQERLDLMALVMKKPFSQFLQEISENLILFHNAFVVKSRSDELASFAQGLRLEPVMGADKPLVGYYMLPTQEVRIKRDKRNRIKKYQQDSELGGAGGKKPEFKPSEVVHFAYDVKPGAVFGEPFIEAVLNLMALRQIEEDVLNLTHRELYPLMIYTVGNEEKRPDDGEVEAVYVVRRDVGCDRV